MKISASAQRKPKYQVLVDELRRQIKVRELQPGDALPSYAEMRARHDVTISTIDRVYGILEQEGLIERKQGHGTFVREAKQILTGNVGFIGSSPNGPGSVPYYAYLQEGVKQALAERQQSLLYLGTNDSWLGRHHDQVDGILICNVENPTRILSLMPSHLPCISIFNVIDGITSIAPDDYNGARMAVKHLQGLGHKRIACLMEMLPTQARRRYSGYQDGMFEAGLTIDPLWTRLTSNVAFGEDRKHYLRWGEEEMSRWIRTEWAEAQCSALLVQNEMAAIGAIRAMQAEGIRVPHDVSVMGFDGTELCDYCIPTLCAMEVPLQQIGTRAVEVLEQLIYGQSFAPQSILFPLQVRHGNSVRSL